MKIRPTYLLALLFLGLSLAGLAYLGTFTRLHADDFCMAGDAARLGVFQSVLNWYNHWTGRLMFLFFTSLLGLGGPSLASIAPVILIAGWLLILAWALLPLIQSAAWDSPRLLAMVAAGLALLVLFSTIPNLFQSVFWQDGQVNYAFPLLGLTVQAGVILRTWLGRASSSCPAAVYIAVIFVLTLLSGGFTESFSALQAALWFLVLVALLLLASPATRRRLLPVAAAALAGALIALLIVLVAPGNQVRQDLMPVRAGLFRIITFSIRNAAYILAKYPLWNPGWALLSVIVPFLSAWWLSPNSTVPRPPGSLRQLWADPWLRGLILVPVGAFMLLAAACAPVVYAMDAYPDDRTILIPQFILVLAATLWSGLLGMVLRRYRYLPDPSAQSWRRAIPAVLLGAIVLASGFSIMSTIRQVPDYQAYATSWDQRAGLLAAAHQKGTSDITVPGLSNRFGVADLQAEPDYWVNRCMAIYYGLANIHGQ